MFSAGEDSGHVAHRLLENIRIVYMPSSGVYFQFCVGKNGRSTPLAYEQPMMNQGGKLMTRVGLSLLLVSMLFWVGCVGKDTHMKTLEELDATKKAASLTEAQLREQLEAQEKAHAKLASDLSAVQDELATGRQNLATTQKSLYDERDGRRSVEAALEKLRADLQEAERVRGELRARRDVLEAKNDSQARALASANARIASLEEQQNELAASVTGARDKARDLETKLSAALTRADALQDDKQRLLSGTTTAQDEIARLQKRAGELESEAARAADLAKRLEERDQLIGSLRQASSDRETLAGKVASLTEELNQAERRLVSATEAGVQIEKEKNQLRNERDQLKEAEARLTEQLNQTEQRLASASEVAAAIGKERDQLKEAQGKLTGEQQKLLADLKAQEAERAKLEKERAAKEAEILRLTKAHDDLSRSLQDEIAKGNITIQQVRDRLTINMVDKVLFDSGQAQVKPAGLKVLKQVSDIVKDVPDKQIRIEGHTDNVPISARLREKFPSNWELSTARATTVVRYLIDEGGINRSTISAAGFADTRPVASNESDEGKASNRRIEIVLYPKDLSEIADELRANNR